MGHDTRTDLRPTAYHSSSITETVELECVQLLSTQQQHCNFHVNLDKHTSLTRSLNRVKMVSNFKWPTSFLYASRTLESAWTAQFISYYGSCYYGQSIVTHVQVIHWKLWPILPIDQRQIDLLPALVNRNYSAFWKCTKLWCNNYLQWCTDSLVSGSIGIFCPRFSCHK